MYFVILFSSWYFGIWTLVPPLIVRTLTYVATKSKAHCWLAGFISPQPNVALRFVYYNIFCTVVFVDEVVVFVLDYVLLNLLLWDLICCGFSSRLNTFRYLYQRSTTSCNRSMFTHCTFVLRCNWVVSVCNIYAGACYSDNISADRFWQTQSIQWLLVYRRVVLLL